MDVNPKTGCLYAIHHGDFAGQMFCFISKQEHMYNFLSIPEMKNINVSVEDFTDGVEKEIVQFVEKPPSDVFNVIKAQYKKNENTNN